jgi:hypothetical protein
MLTAETMNVTDAVTRALPAPVDLDLGDGPPAVLDMDELREELEAVATETVRARRKGIEIDRAVHDPAFPALGAFHQALRDALLVEIPTRIRGWVEDVAGGAGTVGLTSLHDRLIDLARDGTVADASGEPPSPQQALAELLVFEAVRLRLLVIAWSSEDFETVGGEEEDIDAIAWQEVRAILSDPALRAPGVRAMPVMLAAASVALARDATDRVDELRYAGEDLREQLRMRARLRGALRELRLPESVLLENALSAMLGEDRQELPDLQAARPLALEGLSRQAMDQRVSRGRKALVRPRKDWPRRRKPAIFDLLRARQ